MWVLWMVILLLLLLLLLEACIAFADGFFFVFELAGVRDAFEEGFGRLDALEEDCVLFLWGSGHSWRSGLLNWV